MITPQTLDTGNWPISVRFSYFLGDPVPDAMPLPARLYPGSWSPHVTRYLYSTDAPRQKRRIGGKTAGRRTKRT